MNPLGIFGTTAIFTTDNTAGFITTITDVVSKNLPAVIGIVAVVWGINFAQRMVNRGLKGKI